MPNAMESGGIPRPLPPPPTALFPFESETATKGTIMAGPEKGTDQARQGVTGTGTRYVLAISFAAAFVLLIALAYAFFGPPDMEADTGRATGAEDGNPPYTEQETPGEWRENPPPDAGETR